MGKRSVLLSLFFSPVTYGFLISLYVNKNAKCSWEQVLENDRFSIFTYFLGAYFTVHVFTWFIVFYFFYHSLGLGYSLHYLLNNCNVCSQTKVIFIVIVEVRSANGLLYGYWTGREILGGWCDLERVKECIQTETEKCDSMAFKGLTLAVQSICERMSTWYDSENAVYTPNNLCVYTFRYFGHFIMTCLSTFFMLIVLSSDKC